MSLVNRYIGAPIERVEDLRFLRGRGEYVADLARKGMLHAAILRSPVAHARIRPSTRSRRWQSAACTRWSPGRRSATCQEFRSGCSSLPPRSRSVSRLLPRSGFAMSANRSRSCWPIVQRSPRTVSKRSRSMSRSCPSLPTGISQFGMRRSFSRMLALTSQWNSLRSAAMPTRLSVTPNIPGAAAGRLTVMGAAKVPFFNRGTVAKMMGLSESPVDLIENDVGGGFGARGEFYPEDFLIPFAARHVGRPVMWIEDRRGHLIAINHARQMDCDVEIACKRDGRAQ